MNPWFLRDSQLTSQGLSAGHPWLLSYCRPSGASFWCRRSRHGPVGQSGPDSDSENDLQILLNDNDHRPLNGVTNDSFRKEYENDCKDGEDYLVIVTDEGHYHRQDWAEDAMQPSNDGVIKEIGNADKVTGSAEEFLGAGGRTGYTNHQSTHKVSSFDEFESWVKAKNWVFV